MIELSAGGPALCEGSGSEDPRLLKTTFLLLLERGGEVLGYRLDPQVASLET
jgi:hypothetical protein